MLEQPVIIHRLARSSDLPGIEALIAAARREAQRSDTPLSAALTPDFKSSLASSDSAGAPASRVFVVTADERAIGFAAYRIDDGAPPVARLAALYVARGARRAGVGSLLAGAVEQAAAALGFRYLDVSCPEFADLHVRFFDRRGYVEVGRDREEAGEIVVRFRRRLGS